MKIRLLLAGALAAFAVAPVASAHAAVCSPTFRPYCDEVCSHAERVCRLFG